MSRKPRFYNCSNCPAHCCSYDYIEAKPADVERLAKHHGLAVEAASKRFTKLVQGGKLRVLRHQKDAIFGSVCQFLNLETRQCGNLRRAARRSVASIPAACAAASTISSARSASCRTILTTFRRLPEASPPNRNMLRRLSVKKSGGTGGGRDRARSRSERAHRRDRRRQVAGGRLAGAARRRARRGRPDSRRDRGRDGLGNLRVRRRAAGAPPRGRNRSGRRADGDELVIRREISREGRNRVFVQDQPVTLRLLQELAPRLLRIHGQRDELGLADPELQRQWLDRLGGEEGLEVAARVAALYAEHALAAERARTPAGRRPPARRAHRSAALPGRRDRRGAAGRRRGGGAAPEPRPPAPSRGDRARPRRRVRAALRGRRSGRRPARHGAPRARRSRAVGGDGRRGDSRARRARGPGPGAGARAARPPGRRRRRQRARAPRRDRRSAGAAREALPQVRRDQRRSSSRPSGGSRPSSPSSTTRRRIAPRSSRPPRARSRPIARPPRELSRLRAVWATELVARLERELADLALAQARFGVSLETTRRAGSALRIDGEGVEFGPHGFDQVVFQFAPNPGEPMMPLSRIASGGELARVSLALQLAARGEEVAGGPTMVFDEADAGVGGAEGLGARQEAPAAGEARADPRRDPPRPGRELRPRPAPGDEARARAGGRSPTSSARSRRTRRRDRPHALGREGDRTVAVARRGDAGRGGGEEVDRGGSCSRPAACWRFPPSRATASASIRATRRASRRSTVSRVASAARPCPSSRPTSRSCSPSGVDPTSAGARLGEAALAGGADGGAAPRRADTGERRRSRRSRRGYPRTPVCARLLAELGHALTATSANPSGEPPLTDPDAVRSWLAASGEKLPRRRSGRAPPAARPRPWSR